MIELAPSLNKLLTKTEAIMYCFMLQHDGKRGWRLPTAEEYEDYIQFSHVPLRFPMPWDESDDADELERRPVVPVRTITDT